MNLNSKTQDACTALHLACYYGHSDTVHVIIQYSDEYNINLNSKTNDGYTPFKFACQNGFSKIVGILLLVNFLRKKQKQIGP